MAYNFDTNTYLNLNTPLFTGYPFTMACFVKPSSLPLFSTAMSPGSSSANTYYYLALRSSGVATAGGDTGVVDSAATVSTGVVSHLAAVWSLTTISVYVNGSLSGSSSLTSFLSANVFTIGIVQRSGGSAGPFFGTISEAATWQANLTASEIASLAAGFTPDQIRPQSLQFYAPLVRDLVDVRGGRTITNVNGATVATHPRIIT